MTTLAALAAAGLLASAPLPSSPRVDAGTRGDLEIQGDVTYQPGTGRILIENGAVLRRGAVTIRSRSATYDPASGEVRATGGVLLTDPTRAIKADAIRAVLDGGWEAEGVVAFVKDQPLDLGAAETIEAARREGANRLSFSGARLRGDSAGRLQLDGARLTLCDCPEGCAPSWEVTARKADVVPGQRAILSWPVLRVTPRFLFVKRPVPVLALPWLYVPLGDRQTGLLLPEIRSVEATGLALAQPLFITLGRSADATLTADYAFGRDRNEVAEGRPAIRGPGARLELRWAPVVGADGWLELAWLHDLDSEPRGEGGDRFALAGGHVQRLSARTSLVAGLRLAGDPVWVRDASAGYPLRYLGHRRSEVLLSHRREPLVLEAGASYLQPLRPDGNVSGAPWGRLGADEGVASRWPAVVASLLPVGAGPLRLSARASAARYAPVAGAYDLADRPAALRGDVHVDLSLPLLLGGAVTFAPYLRGTAVGYAFEASEDPRASGWAVAGAALATEVSRRFGGVRHSVAPRLEWRSGSAIEGDPLPWIAYDVHDRTEAGSLSAGPPGAWDQLRAALATRLTRGAVDLLRLEIGQDLDLRRGRAGESFTSAAATLGPLGVEASARFLAFDERPAPRIPSAFLDHFTELGADAKLVHRRASVHAGFFAVGPGGSGRLVAGIDPLFDLRAAPFDASASAIAGAQVALGPATLGYDVSFHGRAAYVPSCSGVPGERRVGAWQPQRHAASMVWDSPCRCFRVAMALSLNDCADSIRDLGFKATIDLSRLAAARLSP